MPSNFYGERQDGLTEGKAPLENDALFSVAKMADILKSGSDSQRTVILFELQQLMDHCMEETITILVPVLCSNIHTWTYELQISAAESLLDVLQNNVDPRACNMICSAAFRVVELCHAEDMFEAWGEILVLVLPHVKWDDRDELSAIVQKLDSFAREEDDVCRKLAARVCGSLAVCLTPAEVEEHILERALELASDQDLEVRGMVAESLAFIGAVCSSSTSEKRVWPQILKLLEDPDCRIHAATLRTIAHILEAQRDANVVSSATRELLAPVFLKECEFSRKAAAADQRLVDDDTYLLLEIVSEVFGPFLFGMHPHIADESSRRDAFRAFLAMATCNGPIVRRYCAFNIPGVSKCLANRFSAELSSIVEFLSRDADSETRWNLAAGIHETAALLADKSSIDNLFKAVSALLQDENPLVRMNTLEHFHSLMQSLTQESEVSSMRRFAPVFENLTLLSEGNWRTQELLAKQLQLAAELVPPDTLRSNVLPLLYQMSEESTYLVRKAAMPAIARALWYMPVPEDRVDAVNGFRTTWADGGVFWMRIAYIECANAAVKFYSTQLFKELFADSLLRLAEDPVPNVRLRLSTMLHLLVPSCDGMEEFQHAVTALKNDNDLDVRESVKDLDERFRSVLETEETRQQEEQDRLDKEIEISQRYLRAKQDAKKKAGGKGNKFRPSMLIAKNAKPKATESDLISPRSSASLATTSPTSVSETAQSTKAKPRRSLNLANQAPKSPKAEDKKKVLGGGLEKKAEGDDSSLVRSKTSSLSTIGSGSEDEDDAPRSFGKKMKLLVKKSRK